MQEQQQLESALNTLLIEVRSNPQAILQDDAEDIHSWVESKLIDKVGNLGKNYTRDVAVMIRLHWTLRCGVNNV